MSNIEVGQILYVNVSGFLNKQPNLKEYKVQKVNTSSIYVVQEGDNHPIRLNKKTLTSSSGVLGHYKAYVKAEEYWNKINRANEHQELVAYIKDELSSLSYDQLKEVELHIKKQKSMKF